MHAPAILLAIPFLAGVAVAVQCVDLLDGQFALLCACGALLSWVAAAGAALQVDTPEAVWILVLCCLLTGLSLGATSARTAYRPPVLEWFERIRPREPVVLEGRLREDATVTPAGVSIALDVTAIGEAHSGAGKGGDSGRDSLGGVRLSVGGALLRHRVSAWRAGRTIRAAVFLRQPSTYLNPGTPDERRPLARRGIVLVGGVKSGALVEVVRRGSVIDEGAAAVRAWTRSRIAAHMASRSAASAGVATAVLIGDRSGLSADDERRLQEAGTYHVIAISGGNIAVLAVLALLVCRAMLAPSRTAALATAVALLLYGAIAGGAPSVARAVTVAVLVLFGRAFDHRGPPLNALAIAAIVCVAASPVVLLDAGFILSFGATLGILVGMPLLVTPTGSRARTPRIRALRTVSAGLAALGAATVCAEVALLPIGAAMFGRVTFAGLGLNFLAIPLMTVVQIGGLLIACTSSWWAAAAGAAGNAAHLAAFALLHSARVVDVARWLVADVPPPAWWLIALYYGTALALLASRLRRRAVLALAAIGSVILLAPAMTTRDTVAQGGVPLRVVILDVGQGDATAVLLPNGRALLVDAGGLAAFSSPDSLESPPAFDVGERVVVAALRALGVTSLEAVIVSHGDPDHLMGAAGVLRYFKARSVWEGVPVPRHAGLQSLWSLARGRAMTWRIVQAGDIERFGDVEVRVLHPPVPDWERQRVRNEDSVVLELRLGQVSIVLPGDIGAEGERAVLSRLERDRIVVLKAPHHGSATSSTQPFLDALRPLAVVFSCGRDNRFGHPHPAVVARYRAMGTAMFSTAQDGAVFVDTDGAGVEVWGWASRQRFAPDEGTKARSFEGR